MRRVHLYILFFIILFFAKADLFSQSYNFENYNVEDGLPQSEVNHIYQDDRGYLWIATAGGGICSFDGINFVQYEERNGLAGQIVNCITGDNQGNIWVGTTWAEFQNTMEKNSITIPAKHMDYHLTVLIVYCLMKKRIPCWSELWEELSLLKIIQPKI